MRFGKGRNCFFVEMLAEILFEPFKSEVLQKSLLYWNGSCELLHSEECYTIFKKKSSPTSVANIDVAKRGYINVGDKCMLVTLSW